MKFSEIKQGQVFTIDGSRSIFIRTNGPALDGGSMDGDPPAIWLVGNGRPGFGCYFDDDDEDLVLVDLDIEALVRAAVAEAA